MSVQDQPPRQYVGLLTEVMSNTLDADYQTASERRVRQVQSRGSGPSPGAGATRGIGVAVALLVFGLMVGVSALKTAQGRPAAEQQRARLVAQAHTRQHHLDALNTRLVNLQRAVVRLQNRLSAEATGATAVGGQLRRLGLNAATSVVSGPGIRVVADNAPHATTKSGGVILDTDLQGLVNGMWQAGAEAIAINGHRLGPLTAIRSAGEAITVDYRSLSPPYVVKVIGNPDTLPARFLETTGGQMWLGLESNFGIQFTTQAVNWLTLPAAPHDYLLFAHPGH